MRLKSEILHDIAEMRERVNKPDYKSNSEDLTKFEALEKELEAVNFKRKIEDLGEIEDTSTRHTEYPNGKGNIEYYEFRDAKSGKKLESWDRNNLPKAERGALTLGQISKAIVTGPANEAEERALVSGSGSGSYVVETPTMKDFFSRIFPISSCLRAGARVIPLESGDVNAARLSAPPSLTWQAENAEDTPQDATFTQIQFRSKTLRVICRFSKELWQDAVNLAALMDYTLVTGFSTELDSAFLSGSGGNGVTRLKNSSITSIAAGGALTSHSKILSLINAPMYNGNVPIEDITLISNPAVWVDISRLTGAVELHPMDYPEILKPVPKLGTTAVSGSGGFTMFAGKFSDMLVGVRLNLTLEPLKEKYIEFYNFAIAASMRVDMQLINTASFAKLTGILPAST